MAPARILFHTHPAEGQPQKQTSQHGHRSSAVHYQADHCLCFSEPKEKSNRQALSFNLRRKTKLSRLHLFHTKKVLHFAMQGLVVKEQKE